MLKGYSWRGIYQIDGKNVGGNSQTTQSHWASG